MLRADRRIVRPPQWRRDSAAPDSVIMSAVLTVAAALVAAWPYTTVNVPRTWSNAVFLVVAAVVLTGSAVRTLLVRRNEGPREIAALASQIAVAVLPWLIARDTALFGVIPTPNTMSLLQLLAAAA